MVHKVKQIIQKLFSISGRMPVENQEGLRHDFKERYFYFKQLLSANNTALEGFGEIEKLLDGPDPFGMSSVKATTTAVLVSVYRMIQALNRLAPQKYGALKHSFDAIEGQINTIIDRNTQKQDHRLIIELSQIDMTMSDSVGQKMANLGELKNNLGLRVPEGFVITAAACDLFFRENDLYTEINRKFKTQFSRQAESMHACSREIRALILQSEVPADLAGQIESAVQGLLKTVPDAGRMRLAMRSSALGEDTFDASFAGQYKTLLNIRPDEILNAYKKILASKYGVTAIQYRLNRGFRDEDIDMCVGCLSMVDASSGGVTYTRHPFDLHDEAIHIQSTWGLPKAVVDGTVNCDLFVAQRGPQLFIRHREINEKDKRFICYADESECRIEFSDDMQLEPSLSDEQILRIAAHACDIESHYGGPQDIEWAIVDEGAVSTLYFLQCRPLRRVTGEKDRTKLPDAKLPSSPVASGGITASPGAAFGQPFVVDSDTRLAQVPDNAVLVTRQALPKWAPLLGRVSAVITEKGGFAGHLANVAREFNVPAIFGVTNACDIFSTQAHVTVDADNCRIYEGEVPEILRFQSEKKNLMTGSPVYNTLEEIAGYITPLHLLDPDSTAFKAANCRTLHDITRFIHEKSVAEMFNYGKNFGFDAVASKQLYDNVPMQWWVMNLDDGFIREIKGKYVTLDDISSIPMLAVWQGIVAVPWDGPPPMDRRGMMSVMFQATANPALNTGVRTKYSQRNYFMISRHYCCLNSRLGFHFATLEAFVGTRDSENYISFRFQGGAADHGRRLKRVKFIADFLSRYGFQVIIKKDHLNARMKGFEKDYMIERLKIIGYLIIHTRQLDMVITNSAVIKMYYNKWRADIESVFNIAMSAEAPGTGPKGRSDDV